VTETVNYCRAQDKCVKIGEMFNTASHFCQKVFDDSFEVAEDKAEHCFKFEFKGENPNKAAAEFYAKQKEQEDGSS
jgi:hypothetical protein